MLVFYSWELGDYDQDLILNTQLTLGEYNATHYVRETRVHFITGLLILGVEAY